MKIGICGSRKRVDRQTVIDVINGLSSDSVIVSGGCRGVDTWAEMAAKERGLETVIFMPKLSGCKARYEFTRAYYARNKLIAAECDILYAFVSPDRKGGTENTIQEALELGKQVVIK